MKCFFCKRDMVDGYDSYMVDIDGHFIIKKMFLAIFVNSVVRFYSGDAVAGIEVIVEKLKETLTEVAVVEYAA